MSICIYSIFNHEKFKIQNVMLFFCSIRGQTASLKLFWYHFLAYFIIIRLLIYLLINLFISLLTE